MYFYEPYLDIPGSTYTIRLAKLLGKEDIITGIPLPDFREMRIAIVIMMILALEDSNRNMLSRVKRCIVVGITGMIYLGVFVSLFFIFTKKSETRIMGIQGRYFLPCFTMVPLIVKNKFFNLQINREKYVCTA